MKFFTWSLLILIVASLGFAFVKRDQLVQMGKKFAISTIPTNKKKQEVPVMQMNTDSCSESETLVAVKRCIVTVLRDDGGHGTGFSTQKGFIVTNKHVIEGANGLSVWLGGKKQKVSVWNFSPTFDIAVLKLPEGAALPTCLWQDSDSLDLAENLYAIGWPNEAGGDSTITKGIFSRINHYESGLEFIQTDAPLNPGNSGGPLVNKCGVVGVVTSKESWSNERLQRPLEGLGNALSSHLVSPLVNSLIRDGKNTAIPLSSTVASIQGSEQRIDIPQEKPQLDITVLKTYVSNLKDGKASWEKGYEYLPREDVDPLIDSLNRQIVFCETLISRIDSGQQTTQDDLFMWDSVVKMSYESVALSKQLNEKIAPGK